MVDKIVPFRRDAARRNTELLSHWLSNGRTVHSPPGDIWLGGLGGPGVIIGHKQRSVTFDLRGNGGHSFGADWAGKKDGPTRFRAANPDMDALFTIGGPDADGAQPGRAWRIRDCVFIGSKRYGPMHGIAAYQGDCYFVDACTFKNLNVGVRLSPTGSRMVCGEISRCQFSRNQTAILADGNGDFDEKHPTHACVDIRTCNSNNDRIGWHFRDWWSMGSITNSVVHGSSAACILFERANITMSNVYAEAGGIRHRSTLVLRDSRVSATNLVAKYLDYDAESTFVLNPPGRIDAVPNYAFPVVYGVTESRHDPRAEPGGYTAITGSMIVKDGIAWRATKGGYGVGHDTVWESVEVLR